MGGGGDDNVILPFFENTVLGVCAGTIEVTILQPMLYCKNATQQGLPFTVDPRVLYRGLGMSVINMSVLTGVQFPLTGAVSKVVTRGADRPLSPSEKIASGFMGGAISGIVCAPMELVMIQQQRFGTSLLGAAGRCDQIASPRDPIPLPWPSQELRSLFSAFFPNMDRWRSSVGSARHAEGKDCLLQAILASAPSSERSCRRSTDTARAPQASSAHRALA